MADFQVKAAKLPNGVNVVTETRPGTGVVSMQVYFRAGAADESADQSGITNLMLEASVTGTTTRSRDQIADDSETKGSPLTAGASMESTVYKTSALKRNVDDSFAVLADVVLNPTFSPDELGQVKDQIIQSMKEDEKSPEALAGRKLMENAFAGQSLGADSSGTPELVESYTPAQLKARHAELLSHPGDIVISFAGDIDPATAEKLAAKYFSELTGTPKEKPAPATFTGGEFRSDIKAPQANINIAFPAPDANSPDRYAMQMFSELFDGGMSTPLFQELRVKRGLVYSPSAQYANFSNAGTYIIGNGTGPGKSGELITAVVNLLGKVAKDGFTEKEMEEARERLLRSVANGRERASSSAAANASSVMKFGKVVPFEEFAQKIKSVTNDDIRRAVINMLKDGNYALAAVGPLQTLPTEPELKALVKKQVENIDVPAAQPVAATATAQFAAAAKKAETFDGTPQVTTLPNGLKIFTIERPGPLSIGGWVGAGSDHETPELNGSTHLNEHMMFRGTPSYPSGTIDTIVEGEMGGGLNAYTTKDKTVYYFYSLLPKHLEKSLDIIGEMIFKANIEEKELSGVPVTQPDGTVKPGKGEIEAVIQELYRGLNNPGRAGYQEMEAKAYQGSRHAQTTIGTEDVLRKVSAKMLRDYRDEYYSSNNVIFGAVGPIKHEDFVEMVKARYGDLKPTNFPPLPEATYTGGTGYIEHPATPFVNVLVAAPSPSEADPEGYAYSAMSLILGGGASSRFNKQIVNKQIALNADTGTSEYRNAGLFLMAATVDAEGVKDATRALYAELRRLPTDVTQAELDKVKGMMEMSLRGSDETNQSAANTFGVELQAAGKPVLLEDKLKAIQAITLDDVKNAVKKVLAANPTAVFTSPPGTDKSLLPTEAEVKAMRDGTYTAAPANNNAKPKPPAAVA